MGMPVPRLTPLCSPCTRQCPSGRPPTLGKRQDGISEDRECTLLLTGDLAVLLCLRWGIQWHTSQERGSTHRRQAIYKLRNVCKMIGSMTLSIKHIGKRSSPVHTVEAQATMSSSSTESCRMLRSARRA